MSGSRRPESLDSVFCLIRVHPRSQIRVAQPRVLFLVFLLGALGCTKSAKPAPAGGSDVPPAKVHLSRGVELCQAERRTLISRVDTVGLIEAEGQTDVAAGVSGLVDEVNFREGDVVDPKDDKPLVLIDQKRYVALLRAAEANAQRMRSELGRMRDQFDRAIS